MLEIQDMYSRLKSTRQTSPSSIVDEIPQDCHLRFQHQDGRLRSIKADYQHYKAGLFARCLEMATNLQLDKIATFLGSHADRVTPLLFARLFAFEKETGQRYPAKLRRTPASSETDCLSELIARSAIGSEEIGILAKAYLQHAGVPATLVFGSRNGNRDAFILLNSSGTGSLIYSPSTPIKTNQMIIPSIFTSESDFRQSTGGAEGAHIEASNILSAERCNFGV